MFPPAIFQLQVMALSLESSEGAPARWWASYSERGSPRSAQQWCDFRLVIFAGTASDALNLQGLREAMAPEQLQAMRQVRCWDGWGVGGWGPGSWGYG